jgi:NADH-quinone oxidoreductase subunit F
MVVRLECGKPNNGGTKIYSVFSGDVELPGNYEVPMGTPFAKPSWLAVFARVGWAVIPGGHRHRCCLRPS